MPSNPLSGRHDDFQRRNEKTGFPAPTFRLPGKNIEGAKAKVVPEVPYRGTECLPDHVLLYKVEVIGIGEFSLKVGHRRVTVLTDLRTGRVLHYDYFQFDRKSSSRSPAGWRRPSGYKSFLCSKLSKPFITRPAGLFPAY
jgi:hypothetical protein